MASYTENKNKIINQISKQKNINKFSIYINSISNDLKSYNFFLINEFLKNEKQIAGYSSDTYNQLTELENIYNNQPNIYNNQPNKLIITLCNYAKYNHVLMNLINVWIDNTKYEHHEFINNHGNTSVTSRPTINTCNPENITNSVVTQDSLSSDIIWQ